MIVTGIKTNVYPQTQTLKVVSAQSEAAPALKLLTSDTFTKQDAAPAATISPEQIFSIKDKIMALFSKDTLFKILSIFNKDLGKKLLNLLNSEVFSKILALFNKDLLNKFVDFVKTEVLNKIKDIVMNKLLGKG